MRNNKIKEDRTTETWETVGYIGSGYVLQVKKLASVKVSKGERSVRTVVESVEPFFSVSTNTFGEDSTGSISVSNVSVSQPHRVVHLSEIGVDIEGLVQEVESKKNKS